MTHFYQQLSDWETQVALDQFPLIRAVDKFGGNPVVNTTEEDLWPLGGIHTDLTTGTTLNATCDDNTNGIGQTLVVQGLDANWDFQVILVVLNGHTPVQIGAALNWTNVTRAYQVSASPDPVGDVYIAVDGAAYTNGVPDDVADVQGYIEYTNGPQQTTQGWAIVPAGYKFLCYGIKGEMSASTGVARAAEVLLEVAELATGATVDIPSWMPYRRIADISLSSSSGVTGSNDWKFPFVFNELTRVALRGTATANSALFGELVGVLVPN